MFRKIMIAILVLLQIAVPVGMATYRPADEDVIREKGTRYELLLQDNFSYRTSGTVFVSSALLSAVDIYQTQRKKHSVRHIITVMTTALPNTIMKEMPTARRSPWNYTSTAATPPSASC